MNDKTKEAAEKVTDSVNEVNKTWPDVADNALESLKSGIGDIASVVGEIADQMQEAAPQIWRALVEYHRWRAIGELGLIVIYVTLLTIVLVFGYKMFSKAMQEGKVIKDSWPQELTFRVCAGVVLTVVSFIFLLMNFSTLPKNLSNAVVPERAAAIEIISAIKSGGKIEEIDGNRCR